MLDFFIPFQSVSRLEGSILSLASPPERQKHQEKNDRPSAEKVENCEIRQKQAFLIPFFKYERQT